MSYIKILPHGPYLVTGSVSLKKEVADYEEEFYPVSWQKIQQYPEMESYTLCRCGQTNTPPFCDGTHVTCHFDGTETASREPFIRFAKRYQGSSLDLLDLRTLCVLAQFCNRAGGVWDLIEKSDRPKARETAIEEACNCPAGRLVLINKVTNEEIEKTYEPCISIIFEEESQILGALWVKGRIPIESADGFVYEIRNRVTLCRCGRSSNKPFCDGSHLF